MGQKRAESATIPRDPERLEQASIVRSSHDAILGLSATGLISTCNDAACRLYGYPAAELIGQPADLLVPPEQRENEADLLRRVMAGDAIDGYHADRIRRDGTVIAVALTVSPIIDPAGAVQGAATIAHQVSDRQPEDPARQNWLCHQPKDAVDGDAGGAVAQTDRDGLQAQLQQSQRMEVLGQLAGGVAHDFNNLLAVILNYAAFVDDELTAGADADFAAASRDVKQIQRAAERAAALTHQLLAFARREVVQPQVLDVNHVVTQVQQLLDRTIGEDVVLQTELADELWPVLADAGQLEQVLVNLAVNARDAMTGGGTLSIDTANVVVGPDFVTAGSQVSAGRHVRLRVGDTGTGMPAEVIAHAFEPFYTTKPDGTGTGLGLSTVYGILAQADATIDVCSHPGVGTTFTIMMPVTDEAVVVQPAQPAYQRTSKGETLLVVEDEEALRDVTERIFTNSGYRVITAGNGAEAVALAAVYDGDIHLLVTDVVMPTMLGKEAADKIRVLKPGIKVLYMSGYAQPVLASQGRLDPDVHLIEKPFSASSLVEKAGHVLNGQSFEFRTGIRPDVPPLGRAHPSPAAGT